MFVKERMSTMVKKVFISIVSLAVVLLFAPIDIAHRLWCKFILREDIAITAGVIEEAYAVVLCTAEEALKSILPDAAETKEEVKTVSDQIKSDIEKEAKIKLNPEYDKDFHFFIGSTNGKVVGYAVKDTVKGKWGPIYYMLALEPDGKVKDAIVLEYQEKRGKPVANRRFLDQFVGKSIADEIKLKKDIKGVSGATISSMGMTNGIKKLIFVFNKFYVQK